MSAVIVFLSHRLCVLGLVLAVAAACLALGWRK